MLAGGVLLLCGACQPSPGRRANGPTAAVMGATALPSDAEIQRDERSGLIIAVRATNLSAALEDDVQFRARQDTDQYAAVAVAWLSAYRTLFRLDDPGNELSAKSVVSDQLGLKHVRLQQQYAGIPVWGAEIIVHLNEANHVYLVQGRYLPTPSRVQTVPSVTTQTAYQIVAGSLSGVSADCAGCRSELVIFPLEGNAPRLAHRVSASAGPTNAWAVMVDAETGAILDRISTVYPAKPASTAR